MMFKCLPKKVNYGSNILKLDTSRRNLFIANVLLLIALGIELGAERRGLALINIPDPAVTYKTANASGNLQKNYSSPRVMQRSVPRSNSDYNLLLSMSWPLILILMSGIAITFFVIYFCLFWFSPRTLLSLIPDNGPEGILPGSIGSYIQKIINLLKYRERVLDAWVKQYKLTITQRFKEFEIVSERLIYVDLPVTIKDMPYEVLSPDLLKEIGISRVIVISGEGGIGKTSLALQIAFWALDEKIYNRAVIPVLIEAGLGESENVFDKIKGILEEMTEDHDGKVRSDEEITTPMVGMLLKYKRILLIIDHFSELSPDDQKKLSPINQYFKRAWMIYTSRKEKRFPETVLLHIQPQRLKKDIPEKFIREYMSKLNVDEAYDDEMQLRASQRLREITSGTTSDDTGITVLFAKLYTEIVLHERHGKGEGGPLPDSLPALMRNYIHLIHDKRANEGKYSSTLFELALQHLAFVSINRATGYRMIQVNKTSALQAMVSAIAESRGMLNPKESELVQISIEEAQRLLDYLQDKGMGIVTPSLRLQHDPLAEYLSAMKHLRLMDGKSSEEWNDFLESLPSQNRPEAPYAQGFLRALFVCAENTDCWNECELKIDRDYVHELARYADVNPAAIHHKRQQKLVRNLVDDLIEADPLIRHRSIEEICSLKLKNNDIIHSLGRVMRNEQHGDLIRQEAATALATIGGLKAAQALRDLVGDDKISTVLKKKGLEALGLTVKKLDVGSFSKAGESLISILRYNLTQSNVNILLQEEQDWRRLDNTLSILQGASRGLQFAMARNLPILGLSQGKSVQMLCLSAIKEGTNIRVTTKVIDILVWRIPLPDNQELEIVEIPSGQYDIGSPPDEESRNIYNELRDWCDGIDIEARRSVKVSAFGMCRYPITQGQWAAIIRKYALSVDEYPGLFKDESLWERYAQPGNLPVESVSWDDCNTWLSALNEWIADSWKIWRGLDSNSHYRNEPLVMKLPTESQWEVACRGCTNTPYHFGDLIDTKWANFDGRDAPNLPYTGRVGTYRMRPVVSGKFGLVNKWGLAEMHGQVFEWCSNLWYRDPTEAGLIIDGEIDNPADEGLIGRRQQPWRVVRGGSWFRNPKRARSAYRGIRYPDTHVTRIGFRPCCKL